MVAQMRSHILAVALGTTVPATQHNELRTTINTDLNCQMYSKPGATIRWLALMIHISPLAGYTAYATRVTYVGQIDGHGLLELLTGCIL